MSEQENTQQRERKRASAHESWLRNLGWARGGLDFGLVSLDLDFGYKNVNKGPAFDSALESSESLCSG
jgi:hypothetical protein